MSGVVLGGGLLALFATGYTFLAIPGKESARTSEGIDLGDAIQVEYAWGLFVMVAAAIALLITGVSMRRAEAGLARGPQSHIDET